MSNNAVRISNLTQAMPSWSNERLLTIYEDMRYKLTRQYDDIDEWVSDSEVVDMLKAEILHRMK